MSRVLVFEQYGGPEVLKVITRDVPAPTGHQVRVAVKAVGIQPIDTMFRSGAVKSYMPATFPQALGNDFSGVIEAVGSEVSAFQIGDEVLGWASFSAAGDQVLVSDAELVSKPASMSWPEAGVLSASGQTASTAIERLRVGAGETLLVHAAAGGVGSFAVQLARVAGARVIGTARPENHDYLRSLGATPVAYGPGLLDRVKALAPRVDASLIAVGSEEAFETSVACVADRSRVGTIAFHPAAQRLGVARISTDRSVARLGALTARVKAGQLRVHVERTFPLEQAAQAHRLIETGHVRGKIALVT